MPSLPSPPDILGAPPEGKNRKEPRLHLRGIREMPAGQDDEIAGIFREMRRATGESRKGLAARLRTSAATIDALESGAILALPEWEETVRIVEAYTALLELDHRPILRRLQAQLDAAPAARETSAPEPTSPLPPLRGGPPRPPGAFAPPQPAPAASPQPQRSAGPGAMPSARRPLTRHLRSALSWLLLIGLLAAMGYGVWLAAARPKLVWSAIERLPDPAPRIARSIWALVRPVDVEPAQPQGVRPDAAGKGDRLNRNGG